MEVLGNMGRSVSLPCNTTSSHAKTVTLIMWFKGDAEDPIYSLDMRNVKVGLLTSIHHKLYVDIRIMFSLSRMLSIEFKIIGRRRSGSSLKK